MNYGALFFSAAIVLGAGCGDDGSGGGDSSETGPADETQSSADTVVFDVGNDDGPPPSGMHGIVMLELLTASGVTEDPFAGTSIAIASLRYEPCLADFYASTPSWQQDGVDGEPVFTEYATSLCGPGTAVCTGTAIMQNLDITGAEGLAVTYQLGADLEGRTLAFGPMPTEELAGCLPTVTMMAGGITGFDATMTRIWQSQTFDPPTAATDQGQPISVRVAPAG